MSRFSFLDNRYDGLSAMEKVRQVERDNLLYEQTEAIKKIQKNNQNNVSYEYKPHIRYSNEIEYTSNRLNYTNLIILWLSILVFGAIVVGVIMICDKDYNIGMGNIPIYVYLILLSIIPLFGIIWGMLYKISRYLTPKQRQNIISQIKELQYKWDDLDIEIELDRNTLQNLQVEYNCISKGLIDRNIEEIIDNIKDTKNRLKYNSDMQFEVTAKINKLKSKL